MLDNEYFIDRDGVLRQKIQMKMMICFDESCEFSTTSGTYTGPRSLKCSWHLIHSIICQISHIMVTFIE